MTTPAERPTKVCGHCRKPIEQAVDFCSGECASAHYKAISNLIDGTTIREYKEEIARLERELAAATERLNAKVEEVGELAEELLYLLEYDGTEPHYQQRVLERASDCIRDLGRRLKNAIAIAAAEHEDAEAAESALAEAGRVRDSRGRLLDDALKEVERLSDALKEAVAAERERCAKIAENVRNGYSANIRTSESEQELVRDSDGPWVLNSDVAAAIRGSEREGGGNG